METSKTDILNQHLEVLRDFTVGHIESLWRGFIKHLYQVHIHNPILSNDSMAKNRFQRPIPIYNILQINTLLEDVSQP